MGSRQQGLVLRGATDPTSGKCFGGSEAISTDHLEQIGGNVGNGCQAYTKAMASKTQIDNAGRLLAKASTEADELARANAIVDKYRSSHLEPLTRFTINLQRWLATIRGRYYIAQRLKRKPQIIRKLRRFSVRLTQLQDIAGARVVVADNHTVDTVRSTVLRLARGEDVEFVKESDYRVYGRDDSGYRALHLVFNAGGRQIELQIRSEAQHYWAEQIERTSVIYGYHIKEQEGNQSVIDYFHTLSDIFYELESGREPSDAQRLDLDKKRAEAETCISESCRKNVFQSRINDGVVKGMIARQGSTRSGIINWLLVFDWNSGSFVSWDEVDRDPELAVLAYIEKEEHFPHGDGFEVVMVGSSDAAMIRHTHSHYFGIEDYESVLATLEGSVAGLSARYPVGLSERRILQVLVRRKHWGHRKAVRRDTLSNHFCKSVIGFDDALANLLRDGYLCTKFANGPVFLDPGARAKIEAAL